MGAVRTRWRPWPAGADRAPSRTAAGPPGSASWQAAVSCLAEHGWAGSTVSVVAERAGVSRGAAQHHFRDPRGPVHGRRRVRRRGTLHGPARPLPRGRRPTAAAVVAALVDLYTGPLFRAALHLWVAASNEEQLRPRVTELEARVGRETHRIAVELLGADESRPGRTRDRPGPARHGPRPGPGEPAHRRHRRAGTGWWPSGRPCWTRRWTERPRDGVPGRAASRD